MWPLEHTQGKKLITDDARHMTHNGHSTITIAHSELKISVQNGEKKC